MNKENKTYFEVEFYQPDLFDPEFSEPQGGGGGASYPTYNGPYLVIPKSSPQNLETENKVMTADVVIEAIPFTVTTNNAGGLTANIGG